MSIKSRIESLRRRLAAVGGPDKFRRVLRAVTDAALGRGAVPDEQIDAHVGWQVLRHLHLHCEMWSRSCHPPPQTEALRQLAEQWPRAWSDTAIDEGVRLARAVFDRGDGADGVHA